MHIGAWPTTTDKRKYSRNRNTVQLVIIIASNHIITIYISVLQSLLLWQLELLPLFFKFYSRETEGLIHRYPPGKNRHDDSLGLTWAEPSRSMISEFSP